MNIVRLNPLMSADRTGSLRWSRNRKIGILLGNLGTPDGTDYWSVRRYLKEFLSDRRVIEAPRLAWFSILNGLILTTRPSWTGRGYAAIWNHEKDESPLKTISRAQAEKLKHVIGDDLLGQTDAEIAVEWGMRYGSPSLEAGVERLAKEGCDRILLMPLFPQYSAATSATACDKAFETLAKLRRQPTLRVAAPYFDDPDYIEQIAVSMADQLGSLDFEPEMILASFHGMPLDTLVNGDPYYDQCHRTAHLLRLRLGLPVNRLMVTFQSRFGKAEWLKPYTDETIKALAARGIKRLAVVTPGFSVDCLETIEEIGVQNAGHFAAGGGEKFARIECLNDSEAGMRVIESIVRRELGGWL